MIIVDQCTRMLSGLLRIMRTAKGRIIISALLGLGLSTLFRRTCAALDCFEFRSPPWKEAQERVYRYDGKCYSFKPTAVTCGEEGRRRVEHA